MPVEDKRSLIQLDKTLVVALPKGYSRFFKLEKGDKVTVMYDSVFVVFPQKDMEIEKKIKKLLTKK